MYRQCLKLLGWILVSQDLSKTHDLPLVWWVLDGSWLSKTHDLPLVWWVLDGSWLSKTYPRPTICPYRSWKILARRLVFGVGLGFWLLPRPKSKTQPRPSQSQNPWYFEPLRSILRIFQSCWNVCTPVTKSRMETYSCSQRNTQITAWSIYFLFR